ncbi:MAG: ATP-dependent DNA helicase RecG [Thermoleophilia bacterium]
MSARGGGIHFPLGEPGSWRRGAPALPPTAKRTIDPQRLARPLDALPGIGAVRAAKLAGLGLRTVADLLEYTPFRHEAPARLASVASLQEGEEATLRVIVQSFVVRAARRRHLKVLEALVRDDTGSVPAVWYNQAYLADAFASHPELLIRGKLRRQRGGYTFLVTSQELVHEGGPEAGLHTVGLIPVYPATADVSVRLIRTLLGAARSEAAHIIDPLPADLVAARRYPSRREAIVSSHFPRGLDEAAACRERLAFEELLLLQLALLRYRRRQESEQLAEPLPREGELARAFLGRLPFAPTGAQLRCMGEIAADLAKPHPMRRLLQGDVGTGKTVVATYTLVRAVEAGGQGAVMVPTEVLADQHAARLGAQLANLGVPVLLLKGSRPARERRAVMERLAQDEPLVVVGTHALIQEGVDFHRLRAVVIDEQHRFGVRQRSALFTPTQGAPWPHTLHMTATPIPRTLGLTLYGDLDVSVIDESPPGRRPVRTRIFYRHDRPAMWEFVRQKLDEGRQAYVVCPLVEESESLQAASAVATYEDLRRGELGGHRLGLIHGQMTSERKRAAMTAFEAGELQALVTTTVIEVGVDVANATLMVIEDAGRFGLSQLHQLRGRVARGAERGYCLVGANGADEEDEEAPARLRLFESTTNGFELAEADLRMRGEGQVFGERQSGWGDLKVARLLRDQRLLVEARDTARRVLEDDPELAESRHALLADAADEHFGALAHWLDHA